MKMKKLLLLLIFLFPIIGYTQGQQPKYASRNWYYILLDHLNSGHSSAPNAYTLICPGCAIDSTNRTITVSGGGGSALTIKDEGVTLGTAVTSIDFLGSTITCTGTTAISCTVTGGSSGLTVGTTTITSGTSGRILYDNAGVLGELSSLSTFESDLESFLDLQDLQGAVTDAQVPDTITINGTGTVSNTSLDSDVACLGNASSNGIFVRTGSGTCSFRTITGTTNEIDVSNGDGVSGNPTLSISSTPDFSGKVLQGASPLVFEGSTADANETTITITDPTADRTVTVPNANTITVQPSDCNSTTQKVYGVNTTTGELKCGTDAGSTGNVADFIASLQAYYTQFCQKNGVTGTTFDCVGNSSGVSTGTLSAVSNPNMIGFTTGSSNGNQAGMAFNSSALNVGCPYNTDVGLTFRTSTSIANVRYTGALTINETLANTMAVSTSTTTSARSLVAVIYDTGGASNTANWHLHSCNGTNCSDTDSGVAPATSTVYKVRFTQSGGSANYVVTVNGTSLGTISTNLPACAGGNIVIGTQTLTNSANAVYIGGYIYQQPN